MNINKKMESSIKSKISDWELDFYSRPIIESNQKKRWELIICSTRNYKSEDIFLWNKNCPANEVNSLWLTKALNEAIIEAKKQGWAKPSIVRFWRSSMKSIIKKSVEAVSIEALVSRRTYDLFDRIEFLEKEIYPKEKGYVRGVLAPTFTSQMESSPQPLPEAVRGDALTISEISIGELKSADNWPMEFGAIFPIQQDLDDKENLKNTFVGHPLLDSMEKDINVKINDFVEKKNIVSLFPGSRDSEIKILYPVLINFIKKMNLKDNSYHYIFHSTQKFKETIKDKILAEKLSNVEVVSDDKIKSQVLKKSIFAIVKSGTVSLDVCKNNIPSMIIYKMNFFNFFIAKLFLKIKYANMINIINNKEIIPELLQKECNSDEIYKTVNYLLNKPELINEQLKEVDKTIKELRSNTSSSNEASNILLSYLR